MTHSVAFCPASGSMTAAETAHSSSGEISTAHNIFAASSDSLSLQELLRVDCQQMKEFGTPVIADLSRLGWLRSQLIPSADRLQLAHQTVWNLG